MTDARTAAMRRALEMARAAAAAGEAPVGAVVADEEGAIIAAAHNRPIAAHDPAAHAEILALRQAGEAKKNYRLPGCEIFVTLEPCAMCAGAIFHARLKRITFAAHDPKSGALGGAVNLAENARLNPHAEIVGGFMEDEAAALLREFFAARRGKAGRAKVKSAAAE